MTAHVLFELLAGERDFGDDEDAEVRAHVGSLVLAEVVDIARAWCASMMPPEE